MVAQKLYEGVDIEGTPRGLITYMRTDSTRLAPEFIEVANQYIISNYGLNYKGQPHSKSSKNMQDAHEAIRPTDLNLSPELVKKYVNKEMYNLYKLIYCRALASLMSAKVEEVTTLSFIGNKYEFKTDYVKSIFDGYSRIYGAFETNAKYSSLPEAVANLTTATANKIEGEQHFTKAPGRYSEAKLVKLMEEKGIGRPSTYSSTIQILNTRKYVTSLKGILTPSEQGELTVDKLVTYFPKIGRAHV